MNMESVTLRRDLEGRFLIRSKDIPSLLGVALDRFYQLRKAGVLPESVAQLDGRPHYDAGALVSALIAHEVKSQAPTTKSKEPEPRSTAGPDAWGLGEFVHVEEVEPKRYRVWMSLPRGQATDGWADAIELPRDSGPKTGDLARPNFHRRCLSAADSIRGQMRRLTDQSNAVGTHDTRCGARSLYTYNQPT